KEKFVSDYSNNQKYEKVIKILEDGYDDTVQFYSEPRETHTHIKTTNVLERLNAEVKRRTDVIRVFQHEQSAYRWMGAVLKKTEEKMKIGNRKYINYKE